MTTTPGQQLVVQPLSSDQLDRLSTVNRFLINMGDRNTATLANRYGYDGEAHAKGHELYRLASGAHRPFEHFLARGDRQIAMAPTVHKARLQRIDAFENDAFPTVENSMRAELAAEDFERIHTAFFDGLAQQPEGPDVVPGVRTFISRLDALRKREDVPNLDAFFKDIEKKGITPDAIMEVEKNLEAFAGNCSVNSVPSASMRRSPHQRTPRLPHPTPPSWRSPGRLPATSHTSAQTARRSSRRPPPS
jgi:hypothetical protein